MKYRLLMIAVSIALAGCASTGTTRSTAVNAPEVGAQRADETRDECLRAIRRARLDARSGSYRMYVYRPDQHDASLSMVLKEYMKNAYGIELVAYGPEERGRDRCYSNEMDKIILNTFGPDILSKAEEEAGKAIDSNK